MHIYLFNIPLTFSRLCVNDVALTLKCTHNITRYCKHLSLYIQHAPSARIAPGFAYFQRGSAGSIGPRASCLEFFVVAAGNKISGRPRTRARSRELNSATPSDETGYITSARAAQAAINRRV